MESNVELVWPESEAYASRVNNCSHANSSLHTIRAKLTAEQLEQFKTSSFGHLLNIDKIQFSGQIVHGGFVLGKCLKYPWGSVSFDKTQDSLFSAPTKYMKIFENEKGKGKGKSKVTGTSRRNEKGKKDKHGEVQRSGWSFKGFTYAFQSVQLWALRLSEEEMRQPYWSWPQDRPVVVSAESIPSSCANLDELNNVVNLLSSELFQVKREKDVLEFKVIRMEKNLDHCFGPHFEQEVRRDLAILKERTNRYAISHLFKGFEEVDDIEWDEGQSNINEGEEKEDEGIEGGEVQRKPSEVEEVQRKRSEGEQVKIKSSKGEEAQRKSSEGEEVKRKTNEGEELQRKSSEGEEVQRKRSEGEQVKIKSSKGEEAQRKSSEGEEVKRKTNEGEELQRKRREGKEVKRQRSEENEVQRNQCKEEDDEVMLLGDDTGESTEGTKVEFTLGDIDLDQPTAVLSQLNVWLNDEGKVVEQGVQLRKRKRIIPM
ncbi:unnamed protein product [Prunus armeniaca]